MGDFRMEDWEGRLKALLCKFREDNMSGYRESDEYLDGQEKMEQEHEKIEKLNLDKEVMNAINDLEDAENEASTNYMEQAYLQGISDGIRFMNFFQQN